MDKMFVRVPVAVKAKVTEDLKMKIIGDVQDTIKRWIWNLSILNSRLKGPCTGCR